MDVSNSCALQVPEIMKRRFCVGAMNKNYGTTHEEVMDHIKAEKERANIRDRKNGEDDNTVMKQKVNIPLLVEPNKYCVCMMTGHVVILDSKESSSVNVGIAAGKAAVVIQTSNKEREDNGLWTTLVTLSQPEWAQADRPTKNKLTTRISMHRLLMIMMVHHGMIDLTSIERLNTTYGQTAALWKNRYRSNEFFGLLNVWCDVDHCLGRIDEVLHSPLFCTPCSHEWNTVLSVIRKKIGEWGYAGIHRKYSGGE